MNQEKKQYDHLMKIEKERSSSRLMFSKGAGAYGYIESCASVA
jgi:catalase